MPHAASDFFTEFRDSHVCFFGFSRVLSLVNAKNWVKTVFDVPSARSDSTQLNSVTEILKMFKTWRLTSDWA